MSKRKSSFWVIDCETDPFKVGRVPQPFIWGVYGGEDYNYFTCESVQEIVDFFERQKTIVYAHNGGKFDYHYLRRFINTDESISIISGRLSKFRIGTCEFRDSMNILPVPLSAFKKDRIDYTIMEAEHRDNPIHRAEILHYLQNDCRYLHELIEEHRKENGIVLTQASASMRKWLKTSKNERPKQTAMQFERHKPFYYGGRVQCFKEGDAYCDFKLIDINSAYPRAMLEYHPFSVDSMVLDHLPRDGDLHKCMVHLRGIARGCFPWRNEKDHSLYFPDDEKTVRDYFITGYELIAALKHNAIKIFEVVEVKYFVNTVNFEDFILTNWDRRAQAKKDGNTALSIIVKLLMNSLYGKFASDYSKYHDYLLASTDSIGAWMAAGYEYDAEWENQITLLSRPISEDKHKYYNIATAASITGYVRAMVFEALQTVDTPIYCDTDSIAAVGLGKCQLGDSLGEWKEEGDFDHYAIAGKKTYAFHKAGTPFTDDLDDDGQYKHYKLACKGVDLSPSEILQVSKGIIVNYAPQVPTYSVKRTSPIFVNRNVAKTAKDIRVVQ